MAPLRPPSTGGGFLGGPSAIFDAAARTADAVSGGGPNPNDLVRKYKNVLPYLAIVKKAAQNAGIPAEFQAGVLAQENGGWARWNAEAVSSAGAAGIAQFMPGTWAGKWNPYRNKPRTDPSYAIPAQAIFLKTLLRQNNNNMAAAAKTYYAGSPNATQAPPGAPTPDQYAAGVRRYTEEIGRDGLFKKKSGFGIPGPVDDWITDLVGGAGDIIGEAGDAVGSVGSLIQTLLDPKAFGTVFGKGMAFLLKTAGAGVWHYIVAPPWHWTQRAVVYYYEDIISTDRGNNPKNYFGYAGVVTIIFWSTGYAILWARADERKLATSPRDSMLGRTLRAVEGTSVRRKLKSPEKVEEATKKKPEPSVSKVQVQETRKVSVSRRRPVTVRSATNAASTSHAPEAADETEGGEVVAAPHA